MLNSKFNANTDDVDESSVLDLSTMMMPLHLQQNNAPTAEFEIFYQYRRVEVVTGHGHTSQTGEWPVPTFGLPVRTITVAADEVEIIWRKNKY